MYRGSLPDGKELAVKILKPSEDVIKEFVLEIEIITTLNHKNIVSLLGFCFENNNLLLVYDFLSRGSLEENLHGMQLKMNLKKNNSFFFNTNFQSEFWLVLVQVRRKIQLRLAGMRGIRWLWV